MASTDRFPTPPDRSPRPEGAAAATAVNPDAAPQPQAPAPLVLGYQPHVDRTLPPAESAQLLKAKLPEAIEPYQSIRRAAHAKEAAAHERPLQAKPIELTTPRAAHSPARVRAESSAAAPTSTASAPAEPSSAAPPAVAPRVVASPQAVHATTQHSARREAWLATLRNLNSTVLLGVGALVLLGIGAMVSFNRKSAAPRQASTTQAASAPESKPSFSPVASPPPQTRAIPVTAPAVSQEAPSTLKQSLRPEPAPPQSETKANASPSSAGGGDKKAPQPAPKALLEQQKPLPARTLPESDPDFIDVGPPLFEE